MHRSSKKHAIVLSAIVSLSFAGTAQAATDTTGAEIVGGSAAMSAPEFGDFDVTTLDGEAQQLVASVSAWGVNDARGTGKGWEVTMAASPLQTGGETPVTMTGATLQLTAPSVAPTDVTNASTVPAVAGGDLRAGTVKVADADANQGLGAWAFTQGSDDLELGVPADARAGSYTSTITTTFTPGL